jgi:Putative type VII ESX secretion system translocon, EccE
VGGRLLGRARFRAQLAQLGHVARVPAGGIQPDSPGEPKALPAELAKLEFLEGELAGYSDTLFGVIVDRAAKTMTAVLQCQGQSFALLGSDEREERLADYGGALASLARDGSAVRRIAWSERTLPANRDQLAQYVVDHKRDDLSLEGPTDELVSYFQLLRSAPDVAEDHVLLFCVQIDLYRPAARQAIRRQGGGDPAAIAVLADELQQVIELLESAGITVSGALTRRGVAAAIRNSYDPWGRQLRERISPDGVAPMSAGPMARDEHWSHIETDGALHTTLWIAEWPRIDVRATFLQPLLTSSRATRTVTMVMELVGPSKAIQRAERAVTENSTNESMRAASVSAPPNACSKKKRRPVVVRKSSPRATPKCGSPATSPSPPRPTRGVSMSLSQPSRALSLRPNVRYCESSGCGANRPTPSHTARCPCAGGCNEPPAQSPVDTSRRRA